MVELAQENAGSDTSSPVSEGGSNTARERDQVRGGLLSW